MAAQMVEMMACYWAARTGVNWADSSERTTAEQKAGKTDCARAEWKARCWDFLICSGWGLMKGDMTAVRKAAPRGLQMAACSAGRRAGHWVARSDACWVALTAVRKANLRVSWRAVRKDYCWASPWGAH